MALEIPRPPMGSPVLSKEEIEEIVNEIDELQHQEYHHLNDSRDGFDEDEIRGADEDAYLAYLKMVRRTRQLTEEQFLEHELDAVFDCTYEELDIPEWEEYLEMHS